MRRSTWLLAGAGLLAGIVVLLLLLTPRVVGWSPAEPARPWEPIVIELNRPVDADSVGGRFQLQPEVAGQLRVEGQQIIFQPEGPWQYNRRYTVTLSAGVSGLNRLPVLRQARWSFALASPRLLYLLVQDGVTDLWRVEDGGRAVQLTTEAAGVWDYAPLPDGQGVMLSVLDPKDDTLDLALLTADGGRELLLDCAGAMCRWPAPQPGGRLVAYERQPLGAGLAATELWLLDLNDSQTVPAPVPGDLAAAGFSAPLGRYPAWSPDGRRLASYRADANMVVILDFSAPQPTRPLTIPANLEAMAGWSPDGRRLAYTELAFGQTEPHEHVDESGTVISHTRPSLYGHVVVMDVDGREATDISAGLEIDEGRPAWRPSGDASQAEELAVPRTATGAGKQLYLVTPDGGAATRLTDDPFYNHTALAWSPDGRYLAFMRVPRADGSGNPAVLLFDMDTNEISPAAEGAFLPGWWP